MISSKIIRAGFMMRENAFSMATRMLKESNQAHIGKRKRNGKEYEVIRYRTRRNGRSSSVEVSISSPKGKTLFPLAKRNAILQKMLKDIQSEEWQIATMTSFPSLLDNLDVVQPLSQSFTYEEFLKLQELNDMTIVNGYKYGRYVFRSKSEVMIAQTLDQLGLEYKYEPVISINGNKRYPDFAVYCPEIGRFFFIEHLGMLDQMRYKVDNLEKMELYESAGIRNGVDIIYTTEFGKGNFDSRAVLGKIIGLVIAHTNV